MRWKKVTLVGVGLLGGSLGQALKKRRLATLVVGFVRRKASLAECRNLKAVDSATLDLQSAVDGADLVVLCTPISRMKPLVREMLPSLKAGTIITDVGSVKGGLVRELERLAGKVRAHFIGSHPMAGAEKMGVRWARPDLFQEAVCIVTPTNTSNREALRKIEALWKSVGARITRLSPGKHDQLVSRTSHLPHVIAAALANVVLGGNADPQQSALCANGFRDSTRIASGSPEMWKDIAMANRQNLAQTLEGFTRELETFKMHLLRGNEHAISKYFERAKKGRDRWVKRARTASPE